jgi:hypothetical protein
VQSTHSWGSTDTACLDAHGPNASRPPTLFKRSMAYAMPLVHVNEKGNKAAHCLVGLCSSASRSAVSLTKSMIQNHIVSVILTPSAAFISDALHGTGMLH